MANSQIKATGSFNTKMSVGTCQTQSNRSSLAVMNPNLKQVESSTGLSSPKVGTFMGSKKTSTGHVVVQIDSVYREKMNEK